MYEAKNSVLPSNKDVSQTEPKRIKIKLKTTRSSNSSASLLVKWNDLEDDIICRKMI